MGQKRFKEFGATITELVTVRGEFLPYSEVCNFNIWYKVLHLDKHLFSVQISLYSYIELLPWAHIYFGGCGEKKKKKKIFHAIESSANENDLCRYIFCNILFL